MLKPQGVLIFQLPGRNLATPRHIETLNELVRNPSPVMESGGIKGFIKRCLPELFWKWYVDRKYAVRGPVMEMYGIERAEVEEFLRNNGAHVVDVVQDGPTGGWESFRYCVTKV